MKDLPYRHHMTFQMAELNCNYLNYKIQIALHKGDAFLTRYPSLRTKLKHRGDKLFEWVSIANFNEEDQLAFELAYPNAADVLHDNLERIEDMFEGLSYIEIDAQYKKAMQERRDKSEKNK